MKNKIIVPGKIVTADPQDRILNKHAVEIQDGIIKDIFPFEKNNRPEGEIFFCENLVLIPGFIQTHIHLCQTLFRGLADDLELLDWLQYRIFPYENAHNKESLRASVKIGITELLKSGTTTILDMGTLRHQEIIFDELISSGIRAFAGKCMMDSNNILPAFSSTLKEELKYTEELVKEYHEKSPRVKYAFAPRFVLTSSEKLLKETWDLMLQNEGSLFHTHASENKNECSRVRDLFGCDNIEYFGKMGVLSEKTVLAHCIHVNPNEIDLLETNKVNVAHCPSSNLKLGSGIAPIPEYLKRGITVSLGSDGAACSNTLNMFNEMRLGSLIQKSVHGAGIINTKKLFRMATIDGAKALNISESCGSIETGKAADFALLDLKTYKHSVAENDESLYSDIVYNSDPGSVKNVMAAGEWLVTDGKMLRYDEDEVRCEGENQLKKLLERV